MARKKKVDKVYVESKNKYPDGFFANPLNKRDYEKCEDPLSLETELVKSELNATFKGRKKLKTETIL